MLPSETIKNNKNNPKVYGHIDLFMGPGNDYGFLHIPLVYDTESKTQYVQWDANGSTISKSLFDRDLAPTCLGFIGKIKQVFEKISYDTIYLVHETKAEIIKP